jgi:hypothetical protein
LFLFLVVLILLSVPVAAIGGGCWHVQNNERVVFFSLVGRCRKKLLNRPNREAVEPIVVVLRVDTPTAEVQAPTTRSGVKRT